MGDKFLHKAYDLDGAAATVRHYDAWAASYDAEIAENGYVTPRRCAEALRDAAEDPGAPTLDLGCGTGLSGVALRAAGFRCVDGWDISERMLAEAAEKKIYRRVASIDPSRPLEIESGAYANVNAAGVLNPGHAPAETIDQVVRGLPRDGCFAFSLNDHALVDWSFEGRIRELVDCSWAELVFKEYGDHLPGTGLKAMVYVLRRL